jgi:DNA-binding NarL/FixJ family response regulator
VFERARTELCFAEMLATRGRDAQRAVELLTSATECFVALGARLWTDRARAVLRQLDGGSDGGSSLTTREAQVAELVAAGASNREVAEALFVNAKTVEYHLVNVYRKLGVRTRTELALRWNRG